MASRSENVASQQDLQTREGRRRPAGASDARCNPGSVECVLDRASRSETASTLPGSESAPIHQLWQAAGGAQAASLPEGEAEEAVHRAQASDAIRRFHALRDSLLLPPGEDTETDA